MREIKAVIFDMDGSLVDSMWIWKDIDIAYLSQFGYDVCEEKVEAFQKEIEGMSFAETARWVSAHFDIPRTVDEMMEDWNRMAWDKYEREVFLKPGVAEFLQECQKRNILLAIASSNSRELVDNVICSRGLQGVFTVIKTGSDGLPGKPAPDVYMAAAQELKVEPANCLVFEDVPAGIRAAKSAGMYVCAVEDAYSAHQRDEKKELADDYIEDYYGLFNKGIFACL